MYYHGTTKENSANIQVDGFVLTNKPSHSFGNAVYFTSSKEDAYDYGECVLEATLDTKYIKAFNKLIDIYDYALERMTSLEDLHNIILEDGFKGFSVTLLNHHENRLTDVTVVYDTTAILYVNEVK